MKKVKQKIYGYVGLSDEFRQHLKAKGLGVDGFKTIPAHHRQNPSKLIRLGRDPDLEDSYIYHFDDPTRLDADGNIDDDPLPVYTQRDLEFFREQNAAFTPRRYVLYNAKKNILEPPEKLPKKRGRPRKKVVKEAYRENIGAEAA